jgi:multiple sugar transport system ATP-binding protein
VLVLEELGSDSHVIFPIDAPRVEAEELRAAADNEDESLIAEDCAVWNARVSSKTEARPGDRIRLAIDPFELYFFDPSSGASLTTGARVAAAVA